VFGVCFATRSVGDSPVSWVVVAMAFSSLLSMLSLFQVDRLVESGLFGYGIGLSSGVYVSYSWLIRLAFGSCWFNIVAAIGVQVYSVTFRRREVETLVRETETEMRRRQIEELRRIEEPPILIGLPEQETLAKSESVLEREKETLKATAQG